MGIFTRRRQDADIAAIVADAVKALVPGLGALPGGATTRDLDSRVRDLEQAGMSSNQFGPGLPMQPAYVDPRQPRSDSPEPRKSQYPVGINLDMAGRRHVPFSLLRTTADRVDVMRRCIEVRKAHMAALDWDVILTRKAIKKIMMEEEVSSVGRASAIARDRFEPEIDRLRDWWENPDRQNGLDFRAWVSMLLEEQLVIDAVTIWPRYNLGGELTALELIDGSTIKPLLDLRGATPAPPARAFQQILHGFPRGEWVASTADVAGEFLTNEIVYRPRHRRTWSPYGFSEVEQALSAADLYLKRIGWIRSEFDDGVVPNQWMKTDIGITGPNALSPAQLLEYEMVMNQSLAGQTAERHGLHLLPRGFDPVSMENFADRYNPDLDEFLIKLICMCFHVMPTEVGFPPKSGIGGKGHQEGEENSASRKERKPTISWLESLITEMSRNYLGMSPELEFSFIGYETEDQLEGEQVSDLRTKGGRSTLNEERARKGQPLYEFPEADVPFIQTAAGLVFLPGTLEESPGPSSDQMAPMEEGEPSVQPEATETPLVKKEPEVPDSTGLDLVDKAAAPVWRDLGSAPLEGRAFLKFVTNRTATGKSWRPFSFEAMNTKDAAVLNELGRAGDVEAVRRMVNQISKGRGF